MLSQRCPQDVIDRIIERVNGLNERAPVGANYIKNGYFLIKLDTMCNCKQKTHILSAKMVPGDQLKIVPIIQRNKNE